MNQDTSFQNECFFMSQRLEIGFVPPPGMRSLGDYRLNGGTIASIARTLTTYCGDVVNIAPVTNARPTIPRRARWKLEKLGLLKRTSRLIPNRSHCRRISSEIEKNLRDMDVDIVVGVRGQGMRIAYLKTDLPMIHLGDGTFIVSYPIQGPWYDTYRLMSKRAMRQLVALERTLFNKATAVVMASSWAARSVVEDYSVPRERVFAILEGPNLLPGEIPPREKVLKRRRTGQCRLLFPGRANRWEAKGGHVAYETMIQLNKMGIDTVLIACGCLPPSNISHEKLRTIPFLDKNKEEDRKKLASLFLESDFLLVPSRAERYGKVYCEAGAFGIPAIGTAVGGVPEIIRNGENGYALPLEARGDEYAELIAKTYTDPDRYDAMAKASRDAFEGRLNWDVWGRGMQECLKTVLPPELAAKVGSKEDSS